MKIENQVCSLEQAKRLKELGILQASYFHWQHYPEMTYRKEALELVPPISKEGITDPGECWSAFTTAELGVMLPVYIEPFMGEYEYRLAIWNNPEGVNNEKIDWRIAYGTKFNNTRVPVTEGFKGENEATTRADMLIYLLENILVTAESCNKSLTD